jgi:hypothetical protein
MNQYSLKFKHFPALIPLEFCETILIFLFQLSLKYKMFKFHNNNSKEAAKMFTFALKEAIFPLQFPILSKLDIFYLKFTK